MAYRPEDLLLDESYWKALLSEVEQLPVPVTRPQQYAALPAQRESPRSTEQTSATNVDGDLWLTLEDAMRNELPMGVDVTGCNRGGLIVHFQGVRGFIPSSHLHTVTPDMDEPARRATLASHLGQTLHVRVIELEPAQGRVVFSERASVSDEPDIHDIPDVLQRVQAGETLNGTVTNLTAFGAFVDLGGYEGLVHVSELSWSRVNHPRDMLHIGDEISVFVMSVTPEEGRIALSLKRAKPNPWERIEERYHIGQIVHGTVTNVVQFGAFVKVEDDLEGLVHVSELAEGSFMHPRNIVREGELVTARVIGVDSQHRRLALSLRIASNDATGDASSAA